VQKYDRIIICGTSLTDNEFLDNLELFSWIDTCNIPVLGICAGMQIIGLLYGGTLQKHTEIGFYLEEFVDSFLSLEGKVNVYHLHNNFVTFPSEQFMFFNTVNDLSQAVMHVNKKIYGVLFHPEVRNKELIKNFVAQ
jgi:GMP synthase-like glutamine amidotransferase